MESDSTDPFELIPMVFSAAKDFDREAGNTVPPFDEFERAVIHGSDFALWAWSVGKGKIPSIQYTVRPNDEDMEIYRKDRISKCISPSLAEEHLRDTGGTKDILPLQPLSLIDGPNQNLVPNKYKNLVLNECKILSRTSAKISSCTSAKISSRTSAKISSRTSATDTEQG